MAVYTQVSSEDLARVLARYDHGALVSAKGIAEGVQNSNYLVDTDRSRFILTLYERGTDTASLPFFLALLDHLAADGNPVPRALPDRNGEAIQTVGGRPACLIEFLNGVSVSHPTVAQAHAAGGALGAIHASLAGFAPTRANPLGADRWRGMLAECGKGVDVIETGFHDRIERALDTVLAAWPRDLPTAAIHSDLFPDNVLMLGDRVTGLIDFYYACTDIRAYDLAVMHTAWAFDSAGQSYDGDVGKALVAGYAARFPLSAAERAALPVLAQGACLRFLLTRAWDWLHTPADALVTRKDPLAYWRRLEIYQTRELFA